MTLPRLAKYTTEATSVRGRGVSGWGGGGSVTQCRWEGGGGEGGGGKRRNKTQISNAVQITGEILGGPCGPVGFRCLICARARARVCVCVCVCMLARAC